MTCLPNTSDDPERCPTSDDILPQLLTLLPPGLAWQTTALDTPIRWGFFKAFADVLADVEAFICLVIKEFFCATHELTHNWWLLDYGLPDSCDPYPDVCVKIMAQGSANCAYWQNVAASAGWSIQCGRINVSTVGCFQVGCGIIGYQDLPSVVRIQISLSQSPSYQAGSTKIATAGCFQAGQTLGCGPNIYPLQCLLDRIMPAHAQVIYEVIA